MKRRTQDLMDGTMTETSAPTTDGEDKRALVREIMAIAAKPAEDFDGGIINIKPAGSRQPTIRLLLSRGSGKTQSRQARKLCQILFSFINIVK